MNSKSLEMDVIKVPGAGSFQFSAVKPELLGATEYTLVTMAIDRTGSVTDFADQLLDMVKTIVGACKKNPRAENLMLRLVTFATDVTEVHGFIPINQINPDDYKGIQCRGNTALRDAIYSSVGATLTYAKNLMNQDFGVNGVVYVVTDGDDNASSMSAKQISNLLKKAVTGEDIESLITVLIGINTAQCSGYLFDLNSEAGLTQYVDVGDATKQRLAKLAGFVSKSISSQSQALGSGGPSQQLVF